MKKFNYILDSENRIISYTFIPFDETKDYFEVESKSNIILGQSTIIENQLGLHQEKNPIFLEQETRNEKLNTLNELKKLLQDTDYKVIKCYEAQLGNEEMPYNLTELLAERKAWRDEINQLEAFNESSEQ
jgi:hypothetical protein